MKAIFFIILTLIIISIASKGAHAQSTDRMSIEKESPSVPITPLTLNTNSYERASVISNVNRLTVSDHYPTSGMFLKDGGKKSTLSKDGKSIQSPANTGHMNEAEYIFYRKLQRKKLA